MPETRERALSHRQYLETLQRPTLSDWRRISDIQRQKEIEIDSKYHTAEAHNAATKIQKAYRGHRARRSLQGLTLDPSSRWLELLKELKYRAATSTHYGPASPGLSAVGRPRLPSDVAQTNWQRIGQIAEHASGCDAKRPSSGQSNDYINAKGLSDADDDIPETSDSMLMDSRYFLEMVDQKHRYGTNLQVYHEEWLRSTTDQNFFYWLDYGEGNHLDLPGCTRAKLDKESIRYLSRDERLAYLVTVDDQGKLRWHKNNELITTSVEQYKDSMLGVVPKDETDAPAFTDEELAKQRSDDQRAFRQLLRARSHDSADLSDGSSSSSTDSTSLRPISSNGLRSPGELKQCKRHHVSPATILNHLLRASIKPGTWIYVADTLGRLYVGIKSSGAFQHASFLSGARISSAGSIAIENGKLTYLAPLSGHYRPTTKSFTSFISSLKNQGVDLSQVRVSHAFEILQGMELIGKSKKDVKKVFKGRRSHRHSAPKSPKLQQTKDDVPADDILAVDMIEQHWETEHRRGVTRLMEGLKVHRRSTDKPVADGA